MAWRASRQENGGVSGVMATCWNGEGCLREPLRIGLYVGMGDQDRAIKHAPFGSPQSYDSVGVHRFVATQQGNLLHQRLSD